MVVFEKGRKSPDDNEQLDNEQLTWNANNNNEKQPLVVTKELDSKNKNSNIAFNLWL